MVEGCFSKLQNKFKKNKKNALNEDLFKTLKILTEEIFINGTDIIERWIQYFQKQKTRKREIRKIKMNEQRNIIKI